MLISNWIQTSSVLTFTIRSTHSHYPICLLNGQPPASEFFAYNGEYNFPLKTGTYYNLVCRNHYDTKDYVIKRSFYVNRSVFTEFWIVSLIVVFGILIYWRSWIFEMLTSFKANANQEETSRLIKKDVTPREKETKHLLSPENQSQSYSAVVSPSEWRCYSCMYLNSTTNDRCQMCNTLNPVVAKQRSNLHDDYPSADIPYNASVMESKNSRVDQENEYAESTDED